MLPLKNYLISTCVKSIDLLYAFENLSIRKSEEVYISQASIIKHKLHVPPVDCTSYARHVVWLQIVFTLIYWRHSNNTARLKRFRIEK